MAIEKYACWMVFDEKQRLVGIYHTKDEAKRRSFPEDTIRKGFAQRVK